MALTLIERAQLESEKADIKNRLIDLENLKKQSIGTGRISTAEIGNQVIECEARLCEIDQQLSNL